MNEMVVGEDIPIYDPMLDRPDVAVRAIIRLFRNGKWNQLDAIGLNRKDHWPAIDRALLELDSSLRRESTVLALVARCPFLVKAAYDLLFLYWRKTHNSMRLHYSREWRDA